MTGMINIHPEFPPHVKNFINQIKEHSEHIMAFTGPAFEELFVRIDPTPNMVQMLKRGQIFARMKPNH
jgi:hypothetical protein